jgi:hypothetical protein
VQTLRSIALSSKFEERVTDIGIIKVENLKIHFSPAPVRYLMDESLARTYRSKPLLVVNGEVLFGELAILRYLQMDGWNGVWVDTFHSRGKKKVVWSNMPPDGHGKLTTAADKLFDEIVETNHGKSSGFFDVLGWKNEKFVFIEYKGAGDRPNKNETRWINAAIKCGVREVDLFFVSH